MITLCVIAIVFVLIYSTLGYLEYKRKVIRDKEMLVLFDSCIDHLASMAKIVKDYESPRGPSNSSGNNEGQLSDQRLSSPGSIKASFKQDDETIPVLKGLPKPVVEFGSEQ